MGREIDVSYFKKEEIKQIANLLIRQVGSLNDWQWSLEEDDGGEESRLGAYKKLSGTSRKGKISIWMYLRHPPWTTRWKLGYTKDGNEYICLDEKFDEIDELKNLDQVLYAVAYKIHEHQIKQHARQAKTEEQRYQKELQRAAKDAIESLKK